MRVTGPYGQVQATTPTSRVERTGGAAFSRELDRTTGSRQEAAGAGGARAATSLDALLALQAVSEDPRQRRRKAMQVGKDALDVLDDIKVGLLSGRLDPATVLKLTGSVMALRDRSGDPELDEIINAIETRAAVELAKIEASRR